MGGNMGCSKCGKCCSFLDFLISVPLKELVKQLEMSIEDTKRYYKYHNIEVIELEESTIFRVWNKCDKLTEGNLCSIWETRPEVCKNTNDKKCVSKIEGCTD